MPSNSQRPVFSQFTEISISLHRPITTNKTKSENVTHPNTQNRPNIKTISHLQNISIRLHKRRGEFIGNIISRHKL